MAEIEHVSDTALWVATYRAQEGDRPDALFRDPLSGVLAGERGRAIANDMPYGRLMKWIMVVRTSAIDNLILETIALGADTVLNLGAGLDTRPYRMELPPTLRWIEADFPHMIDLKNTKLANEKPRCRLERHAVDLSDGKARRAFLDAVAVDAKCIVVITEGVIPYLTTEDAEALANDLKATGPIRYWIQDVYQGTVKQRRPPRWQKKLKAAPFKFDAPDYMGFFEKLGWPSRKLVSAFEEAQRVNRPMPFIFPWTLLMPFIPKAKREKMRRAWGYALIEKR